MAVFYNVHTNKKVKIPSLKKNLGGSADNDKDSKEKVSNTRKVSRKDS